MRQSIGHPRTRLAVLAEGVLRTEHLRDSLDEGELLALEKLLGTLFAIQLDQVGFVIEELVLRGGAGHVQVNDALCLGSEL